MRSSVWCDAWLLARCRFFGAYVYVAFILDVFARKIVGWRAAKNMRADLVLDALEQAIWSRGHPMGVTHHSERGSQYLSIRYSERLEHNDFKPSVGSKGDSYDNAMAESVIGLFKTEVINHERTFADIDMPYWCGSTGTTVSAFTVRLAMFLRSSTSGHTMSS
mgnify:CR=1 FL=1